MYERIKFQDWALFKKGGVYFAYKYRNVSSDQILSVITCLSYFSYFFILFYSRDPDDLACTPTFHFTFVVVVFVSTTLLPLLVIGNQCLLTLKKLFPLY